MTAYDPIELKRIRWRSRRGLLELDLVLEKFFAGPFDQLAPARSTRTGGCWTCRTPIFWMSSTARPISTIRN
ncbi:Flavinator of succinate dehydrogenase [Chromobacterium violaceum]|uniref:FAD assembly factor SdhE n=1 Tax=Chromobacterium violaceum TaxID=536 RepID=A0A3S4IDI8_CHRVL|nr:Flavinator of succinate dehydrogenase [Chromobacterium violaceum]